MALRPVLDDFEILDRVSQDLSVHEDAQVALQHAISTLVRAMGLQSGWIVLVDPDDTSPTAGRGFTLAAHCALPLEMGVGHSPTWDRSCNCEQRCKNDELTYAYNEAHCPRLRALSGSLEGPLVHACAPLRWRQRTVGVLNLVREDWAPFDEAALALITHAARQMGATAGHARMFEVVRRRVGDEHVALLDFTRELLSRRGLPEIMDHLVTAVTHTLRCDACALVVPEAESGALEFPAWTGWRSAPMSHARRGAGARFSSARRAMDVQHPLSTTHMGPSEVDDWAEQWAGSEDFVSQAVVPMVVGTVSTGALMIHSRRPREWAQSELEFLQLMANQAAIAMETFVLRKRARTGGGRERDLEMAGTIQSEMLPTELPRFRGWSFDAYYKMARRVGGDLYDFVRWKDQPEKLGILVGDAAGKNITGALLMARGLESLRGCAASGASPAAVLEQTNRRIQQLCGSGHFLTCFYAVLDVATGSLTHACAGHEPAFVWRHRSQTLEELGRPGPALGIGLRLDLVDSTTTLDPGDELVLYTDGVTEALGEQDRLFGDEALRAAVRAGAPTGTVMDAVTTALDEHVGSRGQSDDVTIVVARRLPSA